MLRHIVLPPETRERVASLIAQLGADDFGVREKASPAFKVLGAPTRLQLRLAALSRCANSSPGLVLELDAEGRVIWEFIGIEFPIYARKVGRDRVLVCDFKEVARVRRPGDDIVAATLNEDGTLTEVIGAVFHRHSFKAHFLPNGGVVIPEEKAGRIREYDRVGRLVAEVRVAGPLAVTKLANGNYLYTHEDRTGLIEVTPEVWRMRVLPVPVENNWERTRPLFTEPR